MQTAKSSPSHKIEHIGIYPFNIQLEDIFKIATMSIDTAENVLIHIVTESGVEGWGEASSFRAIVGETQTINLAAAVNLRPLWLGRNALEYQSLIQEMHDFLPLNSTLKSAFDMALYDLNARICQLPLYMFFGGRKRKMETDVTMGISDMAATELKVRKILDGGFRKIKTKVGLDVENDFQRLSLIREIAGPDVSIRIDANQGWDRVTAVRALRRFESLNIEYCEQPVRRGDLDGMKYVSDQSPIPVMADESLFGPEDALAIIAKSAAPMMNIKMSKSGGFLQASRIAAIAQAAHIPCMVGCMSESGLGNTAFSHFASAFEIVRYFDLDANVGHLNEPLIGGAEFVDGSVVLPDTPGIGCVPDPAYLASIKSL